MTLDNSLDFGGLYRGFGGYRISRDMGYYPFYFKGHGVLCSICVYIFYRIHVLRGYLSVYLKGLLTSMDMGYVYPLIQASFCNF